MPRFVEEAAIRALEIELRRRMSDFVYQLRRKVCVIGVEGEVVFVRRLVC